MKYLDDFITHAEESPNKEVCGVVVNFKGKPIYYRCKNLAKQQDNEFILDPIDYAKASNMGDILYICHSHVTVDENPSKVDIASCDNASTDWLIYSTITKKHSILAAAKTDKQLLGREYIYNVNDCWSLIRDLYKQELSIQLPRIVVDPDFYWYRSPSKNYFEIYAIEAGFTRVRDKSLKKYDVLLFQTDKAAVPNHCAAFYDNNTIIHHPYNRLSVKEVFGGYWLKSTQAVYRYKG